MSLKYYKLILLCTYFPLTYIFSQLATFQPKEFTVHLLFLLYFFGLIILIYCKPSNYFYIVQLKVQYVQYKTKLFNEVFLDRKKGIHAEIVIMYS